MFCADNMSALYSSTFAELIAGIAVMGCYTACKSSVTSFDCQGSYADSTAALQLQSAQGDTVCNVLLREQCIGWP